MYAVNLAHPCSRPSVAQVCIRMLVRMGDASVSTGFAERDPTIPTARATNWYSASD